VGQDFGVRTASFFQGIGQDRQAVEGSVVVDALGQFRVRGSISAGIRHLKAATASGWLRPPAFGHSTAKP
jgi:hypothetical protein